MFSSSGSCASGNLFAKLTGAGAPTIGPRPSYSHDVIKKLRTVKDFHGLSDDDLSKMAEELTDVGKLWSVYFSGIVLDPARERIERNLELDRAAEALPHTASIPITIQLKPVHDSSRYGIQSLTSVLLKHYGSLHASLVVSGTVVLKWNTSGLVIPTGKPIQPTSLKQPASKKPSSKAAADSDRARGEHMTPEDEILQEFDITHAKKEHIDKLLSIIVRYNRNYLYHPIFRNCQKFVADALVALGYPVHPMLEGKLSDYYSEVKKKGRRSKLALDTHADLDAYVGRVLESGGTTLPETEYLLCQYFSFHVTSLTDCEKPERWMCETRGCLMPQLEKTIEFKDTIACHMLQSEA